MKKGTCHIDNLKINFAQQKHYLLQFKLFVKIVSGSRGQSFTKN